MFSKVISLILRNVFVVFQVLIFISNPIPAIGTTASTIEPGVIVNFSLFLNRKLPNGDEVGIKGEVNFRFKDKLNSTHISGDLEAIVDLSWIEGHQIINFTQNIEDRTLSMDYSEGYIIEEVLRYFGNEDYFYNPIYLDNESLGNSSTMIWGYEAEYTGNQQLLWNYYKISVYKYKINEEEKGLSLNASYHQKTGLLIESSVDFSQKVSESEMIHNTMRIFLKSTNVKIEEQRDFSSLYLFIGFSIIAIVIPLIIFYWLVVLRKKP